MISSFTSKLINYALKGEINYSNIDDTLAIPLDSDSKIALTGNSYYTSLSNSAFLYQFWKKEAYPFLSLIDIQIMMVI